MPRAYIDTIFSSNPGNASPRQPGIRWDLQSRTTSPALARRSSVRRRHSVKRRLFQGPGESMATGGLGPEAKFQSVEQSFDARQRRQRKRPAVRLAQIGQLHTPVAPQGSVAFYPQCRQYPVDLVQKRMAGANQIVAFAMRSARLLVGLAGNGNHRTSARSVTKPSTSANASRRRSHRSWC